MAPEAADLPARERVWPARSRRGGCFDSSPPFAELLGRRAAKTNSRPDEIHTFRLAAKRLRYSLELFAPLHRPALDRSLDQLKSLQAVLGAISDCETVRIMVARLGGCRELDERLRRRELRKIRAFRSQWEEQFASPETRLERMETLSRPAGQPARKPAARSVSATGQIPHPQAESA
jgi:hypothetical protein